MASRPNSIGSSLLVPSVQELVKQDLDTVPSRYVRAHQVVAVDGDVGSNDSEIPVVNLRSLVDPELMDSELSKLHLACKHWGFFQLVDHGISDGLLEKMKAQVEEFFNLPMEEKRKLWQFPGEIEGFGQTFVVSEEQKLDWSDVFYLVTQPPHLRKPHLLPMLPLPFRDTVESYSLETRNLAATILKQIGKALKIEDDEEMKDFYENVRQTMRMNYYPPCPEPDKVIGLTPHSDGTGLTILLQLNEIDGLQIRKDGKWLPVKPLPNAFVVNIGDILEVITNGAYRSIEHRATVSSYKERLSVATFHSPRYDGETGPAASLITEQTPALFKRITIREFYNGLFSRQLDGKAYIDTLKIHPGENH